MYRWYLVVFLATLTSPGRSFSESAKISVEFGAVRSDGKLVDITLPAAEKPEDKASLRVLESFHRLQRAPKRPAEARSDPGDGLASDGVASEVSAQFFAVSKSVAMNLRKDMFDHYAVASRVGDVRLAGSLVRYMGRIQVSLPGNRWGAVCADGFDVTAAIVTCRQLGFTTGGVVVRRGREFGGAIGPRVMTNVDCRGGEKRLTECESQTWDGSNSLRCSDEVGVVCGCPFSKDPNVISRCSFDTSFPQDKMYCRFTCPPHMILSGSGIRRCELTQTWSGRTPHCVAPESACHKEPCKNGGKCKDIDDAENKFVCVCPSQHRGELCQIRVDWKCGRTDRSSDLSTVRPQLRIIGGRRSIRSSWPWVVQLRDKREVFCGGSIISPLWVITAAHCLKLKDIESGPNSDARWTVVAGQFRREGRERGSVVAQIVFFLSHDYSNSDIPRNDIAMLRLQTALPFNKDISPICLPTSKWENPRPGSKCWIVGWGSYTLTHELPTVMHEGDIPVISNEECRKINLGRHRNYSAVRDDMICAGYITGGVDACKGDSGGPLMCRRDDGTYYLSGVTSWGYGCAEANQPGIYTRVSHFMDWIDKYIHM